MAVESGAAAAAAAVAAVVAAESEAEALEHEVSTASSPENLYEQLLLEVVGWLLTLLLMLQSSQSLQSKQSKQSRVFLVDMDSCIACLGGTRDYDPIRCCY